MAPINEHHTWSGEHALFLNSFHQLPPQERVEEIKKAIQSIKKEKLSLREKDALVIRLHADLTRAEAELRAFQSKELLKQVPCAFEVFCGKINEAIHFVVDGEAWKVIKEVAELVARKLNEEEENPDRFSSVKFPNNSSQSF